LIDGEFVGYILECAMEIIGAVVDYRRKCRGEVYDASPAAMTETQTNARDPLAG
jgi:hypothetical protein